MALTETTETQTTVLPNGVLEVRDARIILDDGNEISRSYHRKVLDVGDSTTGEAQIVKDIAAKVHNAARKAARKAVKDAQAVEATP